MNLVKKGVGNEKVPATGLRLLHHIGMEHIFLNPATRMRVYLAAQVCGKDILILNLEFSYDL